MIIFSINSLMYDEKGEMIWIKSSLGETKRATQQIYIIGKWTNYDGFFSKLLAKWYVNLDFLDFKSKFPKLKFKDIQKIVRKPGYYSVNMFNEEKHWIRGSYAIKATIENISEYPELKHYMVDGDQGLQGF